MKGKGTTEGQSLTRTINAAHIFGRSLNYAAVGKTQVHRLKEQQPQVQRHWSRILNNIQSAQNVTGKNRGAEREDKNKSKMVNVNTPIFITTRCVMNYPKTRRQMLAGHIKRSNYMLSTRDLFEIQIIKRIENAYKYVLQSLRKLKWLN